MRNIERMNGILVQIGLLNEPFRFNSSFNNNGLLLEHRISLLTIIYFEARTCIIERTDKIFCLSVVKVNNSNFPIFKEEKVFSDRVPKGVPNLVKWDEPNISLAFLFNDANSSLNNVILLGY